MANYTILLIDYEPRSIERFRQPLTNAGYAVEVATDGIAGIQAFHRLNPDMVLVEAMIPKKHGFEVCQEIKRSPSGRRTPVLITTGVYKGRKYRTQALHIYGCDEYIEKPIASEQLLAIIGRFRNGASGARSAAPGAESTPADEAGDPVPARPPEPARPAARTTSKAAGVVRDLTEDEIMARLDAILPTVDGPSPAASPAPAPSPSPAPAPARGPRAAIADVAELPELEPLPDPEAPHEEGPDPFLQMQAELNSELGSLAAALDQEPAPVLDLEPVSAPIGSDQAAPPLLDTLPLEAPPAPAEATTSAAPAPAPPATTGRVVNFDAGRGRRGKKGRQPSAPAAAAPAPSSPPRPPVPRKAAPEIGIPQGSLVASTLEGETARRGVPAWVWAAAVVVLAVGAYAIFFRGEAKPPAPDSDAVASTTAPAAEIQPAEIPPRTDEARPPEAAASTPAAPEPSVSRPETTAPTAAKTERSRQPEARPAEPPTPARPKTVESGAKTEPPLVAVERAPVTTTPAPRAATKPAARPERPPAPVESAPAAPTTVLGSVASSGIAAVVPPTEAAAKPKIAPGTLVSIDEVDSAPVTLSRRLPAYSLQARQMRIQGTVVLKVLIDENGAVNRVEVVTPVRGADVTDAAVKAAMQWTYRPATKGGVPVKVWKTEAVTYKL